MGFSIKSSNLKILNERVPEAGAVYQKPHAQGAAQYQQAEHDGNVIALCERLRHVPGALFVFAEN